LGPVAAALVHVAIRAVQAERRGKEPHRAHELVNGNALEDLDVLEDLLRHGGPRPRRLATRPRGAEQPRHRGHAERFHFQLSIAFRWSDSGPISASSMRRPFRSVTLARMACEKALGAPGSVAIAPRILYAATVFLMFGASRPKWLMPAGRCAFACCSSRNVVLLICR